MGTPHRTRYYVVGTSWSGLLRRLLEIRTALPLDLHGRRARFIARSLGGRYLEAAALRWP